MRTFSTVAAVAVVLALGGAALADAHKPGKASRAKTLEFFAPLAQLELIDLGDTGFSLGDESVFSDDLLTEQNGKSAASTAASARSFAWPTPAPSRARSSAS
jgi:hypothetical protein